jgi:citronellyl-CoA dehydrogenase
MTGREFAARHARFRARVRQYVARRVRPRADAWERDGVCPKRALLAFAGAGFVTGDPWRNAVVAEELPLGDSLGFALAVFVQANLVGPLLADLGSRAQRRAWLAPLLAGRLAGAVAVTEPGAGSDVAAIATTAARDGARYVLNGEKVYITAAAVADLLIVAAKAERAAARSTDAISLFLVPARTPGVRVEPMRMLGLNTSGPGCMRLDDVRLGPEALIGRPGAGFAAIQEGLNRERLFGGLAAVAWAAHALERTRAWMRQRTAFGRRLADLQALRHHVAELATAIEAARALNYATFDRWVRDEPVARDIAMIKLFSYRAAADAVDACLQMHGGAGYVDDHWTARAYRDARALTLAAGTPEVMKELIAAYLRL